MELMAGLSESGKLRNLFALFLCALSFTMVLHRLLRIFCLSLLLQLGQGKADTVAVPSCPKDTEPVANDLQSFSIEFSYFPDFTGNKSHPNEFSRTLLGNLKDITGVAPVIRVGGTTQDRAEYHPSQKEPIQNIFENPDDDQPIKTDFGPGFFESYEVLGDFPYIHGLNFNLSLAQETSSAIAMCKLMNTKNLHLYELGNEINMEPTRYRPANYSMTDYIREWNYKSTAIAAAYKKACGGPFPGMMAPTFILPSFDLADSTPWTIEGIYANGYDKNNLTQEICAHHYMQVNEPPQLPPVTRLQRILMNHTNIVESLEPHIQRAKNLEYLDHPYVLGEMNSIAKQGRNGESNVFGDALWLVDFSLWAAEHNIKRLNFHQGTAYRYASWQPILNKGIAPTTKPPYYGQIMVATALGHSENMRIRNIPLSGHSEAAYALFDDRKLSKLVVLNMEAFNSTSGADSRSSQEYKFKVSGDLKSAKVQRLIAPGSDVEKDVTFGGVSYDYELEKGNAVVVDDMEETVEVEDGVLSITVPDSSAVLLTLG